MEKRSKLLSKILPTETVSEILTCLPTESVFDCKLVCKTWKNLIHHPTFSKRHLARLNRPDSTDSGKLRYISLDLDYDDGLDFYYFEYKDGEDWNYAKPIRKEIKLLETTACEESVLIGSFNGLICVYGYDPKLPESTGPAAIFNPVVREYVVLPDFTNFQEHYHLAYGFGYLSETNEYKVVGLYGQDSEPNVVEVKVYTVGSGKGWRHVGKFDFGFSFDPSHEHPEHGVFLNGCLHWRNIVGGMVVVFDLAKEKFREHIPPPPLPADIDDDISLIGVSGGGVLYYAVWQSVEGGGLGEVWLLMKKNDEHVMKEQVEHQSWGWIKATSFDQREPFAFMKKGTVLCYDEGNFKKLRKSTSTWENLGDFYKISRQVFPYKHTLVSLKELGEEDVQIMKSPGEKDEDTSQGEEDEEEDEVEDEETDSSESGRD